MLVQEHCNVLDIAKNSASPVPNTNHRQAQNYMYRELISNLLISHLLISNLLISNLLISNLDLKLSF